ncbi:MAG: macrolide ABC transporter ATP-binding protein [Gammaproteobacteria bacterium HGW-Gammaproteobacteria-1]|jgi:putative ABC transport system ATP-binding protein|nr:MAG: macrolide ABC transporter ATP-binding protein [Gammaproteobacteria bacterium HGW-Gammaproteobacteria-1]
MIRLQDIERVFDVGGQQVHALHQVNLDIERGAYVSIMGPSGSGKSTLLNLIGLLDRPSAGRYLFEQRDITALSDDEQAQVRRERIGFVFQFFHLVPRLTAAENIELPLVLAGMPPAQRRTKVNETLKAYGLSERAHHRPDQLSGGQRQRVAIGRATIIEPGLLLADEPTGNLDRASGHEVVEILEQLNARGITLLVVTHDPELGQRARRRLRMVDGAIVEDSAQ